MQNINHQITDNLTNEPKVRVQSILSLPSLPLRCQNLIPLLEELSSKDALHILRKIIESLFGTSDETLANTQQQNLGGGWGLRVITLTEHSYEFNSLRNFLSPTGPLLNLIYRLSHDPFQLLPFPIAWLPNKIRTELEDGTANIFYTNKVQNLGPGKIPANIMLNAFEYYMFHFTHYFVGNHTQIWNISWGSANDPLYLSLLEDYLLAFLPCDGSLAPGPPSVPVSPRGVLSPMAQRHLSQGNPPATPSLNLSNLVSPIARPQRPIESNYGNYPFLDAASPSHITGAHTSSPLQQPVASTLSSHQPQREVNTWTSQVFFQILIEMWINQCVPPVTKASLQQQTQTSNFMSSRPPLKDVYVPSSDHVRVVRIMVKHFHYFSNSIKPNQANHLDYLKRNLWPLCRRSFYIFLKHLFLHWPLDSSFRLVLETWLSYIQPWRYTHFIPRLRSPGQQMNEPDGPKSVDRKWLPFIAENILFYTHLFVLLIGRLLRLDLVSPKSAQIIFRVSKVFSQENLCNYIGEIEDTLSSGTSMQRCFLTGAASNNLKIPSGSPPQSPEKISTHQLVQLVRSHILEVEGPNHQYTAMFSEGVAAKVSQFLKVAKNAQDAIAAELVTNSALSNAEKSSTKNWLDSVLKLFQTGQSVTDENTIDEVQRSLTHLDLSIKHFCYIFKISPPTSGWANSTYSTPMKNIAGIVGSPEKYHQPDMISTENGPMLTNLGRYQLMNGLKRFDLKYEGDPDLKPICTFEIKFLVRLFYHLSQLINKKYQSEIMDLYYRQDFLGRVARVFLSSPLTVFEYSKDNPDSPHKRVSKILPPRVTLRVLANKHLLCGIFGLYMFLYFFKFSTLSFTFYFFVPLIVTWIFLRAALTTVAPHAQAHNEAPSFQPLLMTSTHADYQTPEHGTGEYRTPE